MKFTYKTYLLLAILGATSAPSFAESNEVPVAAVETCQPPEQEAPPELKNLSEPLRLLVLTITATTLEQSAHLSELGLLGDPVVMAVTYGHVLQSVMTDETLSKLTPDEQEYFRALLALEMKLAEQITKEQDATAEDISLITQKLAADKALLIPQHPQTAALFNDLNRLMAAVEEQYHLVELGHDYRKQAIETIYLAPDEIAVLLLHQSASYLNDFILREGADASTAIDPDEAFSQLRQGNHTPLDFDHLDRASYRFILTLAATGLNVAADLASEALLQDPLMQAVTYGQVLRTLLTPDILASLPKEHQDYFKELLIIEKEAMSQFSQLDSEDPQLIQAIVNTRSQQLGALAAQYPQASALFQDWHVLLRALMNKFDLGDKAQSYRTEYLSAMDYSPQQKQAIVLRHLADVLLGELATVTDEQ